MCAQYGVPTRRRALAAASGVQRGACLEAMLLGHLHLTQRVADRLYRRALAVACRRLLLNRRPARIPILRTAREESELSQRHSKGHRVGTGLTLIRVSLIGDGVTTDGWPTRQGLAAQSADASMQPHL